MATVTVKGAAARAEQVTNIRLCCQIGKAMGATSEHLAGAVATMTQESSCVNLKGGDRDSAGLFQQRPSCGWGTYAQVTNPTYAIRKFMTPYLAACRKGMNVLAASNTVQRSAFPSAPGKWLPEARNSVQVVMGAKDFGDTTSLGLSSTLGLDSSTRTLPYEFSRGNAGQPENSWDCMGRLAQEVQWQRFMRGGVLWFASENWLARQTPRFLFAEGAQGVLSISFEADARRNAAEATVTALAGRWSVLPGDVVKITGQGPGDGLWLVTDIQRPLTGPVATIQLKRAVPALAEPANATTTTTNMVGGVAVDKLQPSAIGGGAAGGPAKAQQAYNAAKVISDQHLPYVWGGGHGAAARASGGGFDCSGSVIAVLAACGLGYRVGGPVDVSGTIAARWGAPGKGRWFTVWANSGHVWMQFTGCGPAWRFDTSAYGSGPSGPALRFTPRPTSGFTPRHWPGL
jgi:hypothetical protein